MTRHIRLSDSAEKPAPENVLPLINIVFLLLIFFLVAGTFRAYELFPVSVPVATMDPAQLEPLTVLMNDQGEFAIGQEACTKPELIQRLRAYFVEHPSQTAVLFKADGAANAEQLLHAMELFQEAGAASMRLLTVEEP